MLGLMAAVLRHASRTDEITPGCDRAQCLADRRADEAWRRQKALDDLAWYRRGYW